MGAGTAGAVLDAIARMRQIERQMARPRVRSHLRFPRRREDVCDRLPFPCFFLCGDCGWLEEGTTGHPLRREADDGSEPGGPCPACQAKAWVDLRHQSIALAYREAEAIDHTLVDDRGWHRGVWIGGLASMSIIAAAVWLVPALTSLDVLLLVPFVGMWLAVALAVAALSRHTRPGRARPRRWRRALPRPRAPGVSRGASHGTVEGDPGLLAPLGRVPCLGWALQVWNDEGLLLDEQQHAAFVLNGQTHPPDSVALDLPLRDELAARDQELYRFMQRRGLSPHDVSLRVYAAYLVPGVSVALHCLAPDHDGPVLTLAQPALRS
jgi:hypothetical protein